MRRVWECKIGGDLAWLPDAADAPLRQAVEKAYVEMTGVEPEFNFSGWGGKLTPGESAVVNKTPYPSALVEDTTLGGLQEAVGRYVREKGWRDDRTVGDLLLLMVGELSEAYEEYRNHHEPNETYVQHGKPEGIPIELADVLIRMLDFCDKYGIDLEKAVLDKMAYNETREFRHGGKRA